MITIISPAKTLDFKSSLNTNQFSQPQFVEKSESLVDILKKFSPAELSKLMNINQKLSDLNVERFLQWHLPFTNENAKQALAVFKGQVFIGLNAQNFSEKDLLFAQNHLRILSGLYGVLKPLDLIQAYRLEMGTKLKNKKGKNLYEFWNTEITDFINKEVEKQNSKVLVNLASNEYFKSIQPKNLKAEIITPVFKEEKGDKFKVVTIYAKTARGLMSRFIIENKIDNPEDIKAFDTDGYIFNKSLSSGNQWVFTR